MSKRTRRRQERVLECVRLQLEGDAALAFLRQHGLRVSEPVLGRLIRSLGGREHLLEQMQAGLPDAEILAQCTALDDDTNQDGPDRQAELFSMQDFPTLERGVFPSMTGLETTKMTLRVPTDLYEAIGFAARAEGTTRTQLVIDLLTHALSRMPSWDKLDDDDSGA